MLRGGSVSTVAVSVKHSVPVTLERGCISEDRELCQPLRFSSKPRFPSAALWSALSTAQWLYSAYFKKNMYNFLAIQTCICMQWIELARAVGQWCWASCTGWALMKFKCLQRCSELKTVVDSDCLLACKHMQYWVGTFHFILLWFFNSCTHRQQECLRLAHCCVNLLSIALLVKNGALKNFTQKCVKFNYS